MSPMRRSILLALAVVLCSACASSSPEKKLDDPRTEAEIQYQAGVAAMAKGNWELAYFNLVKAARLSPKDPRMRYALGTTQMYRGQMEEARKELEETLRLDEKFADAYNNLGVVFLRQEKWDEAILLLEKALDQINYQTPEFALTNIGFAYRQKNDLPRAVEFLNRAVSISPESAVARKNLAEVYLAANRPDKAREILIKLVDGEPGYVAGHLQLGIVYYKNRENARAKEEFATVIKLAPGSEEAGTAKSYLDLID